MMTQPFNESKKIYYLILIIALGAAYPVLTFYKETTSFETTSGSTVGLIFYIFFHYLILVPFALWKILRSNSVSTIKPPAGELPPEAPAWIRKLAEAPETKSAAYAAGDSLLGYVSGSGFNWKVEGADVVVELRTVEKIGVPLMLVSSTVFFMWIARNEDGSAQYILYVMAVLTFIFSIRTLRKGQKRLLFNKSTQQITLIQNGVKTESFALAQTPLCARESLHTTSGKGGQSTTWKIWLLTVGTVTLLSMKDQDEFKLLLQKLQDRGHNVVSS